MKRYPAYKDSGIRWIGQVPKDWKVNRLKTLCTFIYGDSLTNEDRVEGDIPVYGSNGIVGYHNKAITHKPCIIIGRKGSYGKVNFSQTECFPIDTTYFVDDRLAKCDLKWLNYVLSLLELDKFSKDTGVPGLNREDAHDKRVPVPENNVQKVIAEYLDRKTAQIDDLIAKKGRMIELLKEERTAIINQAVTKGLDPKAEMKDSGIEWLGKVPRHWDVKRVKYILLNKRGALKTGPFGSQLKQSDMQGTEVKVYNQRSVIDNDFDSNELYINNEKFLELSEFEIFPEDILLTTRGTIGRCAIFPKNKDKGILHPCLIRMQLNQSIISNEFARFYIQDTQAFFESVKYNSNATTIDVIYGETLRDIVFVVPNRNEQNQIVNFLNQKTAQIDDQLEREKESIELLKEFRTSLISEAVTGKIDVRG